MIKIQSAVINKLPVIRSCQMQTTSSTSQIRHDSAPTLKPEPNEQFLCCYVNTTNQIQIVRSANLSNWYFERTVFPEQRLLFKAPPNAQLEIHTGMTITAIIEDKISCDRLRLTC